MGLGFSPMIVACIADDAYNHRGAMLIELDVHVFADRVLAGKILIGERLADDDFIGGIQSLAVVECTPAQDRNAHRAEVLRIGPAVDGKQCRCLAARADVRRW